MNKFFLIILLSVSSCVLQGQELNCTVDVNYDQVQSTETRVYETLEKAIYNFMNNRRWTKETFKPEERIECAIFIVINERSANQQQYNASIQVQSRRPVYNSGYHTTLFRHKDEDFDFTYIEYDPIDFNLNSHLDDLSSVLAFYAYIIIGLDYDSFENKGGSMYLDYAQKIVQNAAQANGSAGWEGFESDKNRYHLAQALNDDFYGALRECIYAYHMKGLDQMHADVDKGRKEIVTALNSLDKIHQARPSSFLMRVFFNAKVDEIVNIFKDAPVAEGNQISTLCTLLDPGNSTKYDKITGG